jgi:hypothetical protein
MHPCCDGKSFLAHAPRYTPIPDGIVSMSSLTCVDLRPNSRLPRAVASSVSNKHIVTFDKVYDGCLEMQARLRVATPFRLRSHQGPPHSVAVPHSPGVCLTLSLLPGAQGPGASNAGKCTPHLQTILPTSYLQARIYLQSALFTYFRPGGPYLHDVMACP